MNKNLETVITNKNIQTMNLNELKEEKKRIESNLVELKAKKYRKTMDVLVEHFKGREYDLEHKRHTRINNIIIWISFLLCALGLIFDVTMLSFASLIGYISYYISLGYYNSKRSEYKALHYKSVEERWQEDEFSRELFEGFTFASKTIKKIEKNEKELAMINQQIETVEKVVRKLEAKQQKLTEKLNAPISDTNKMKYKSKNKFKNR